MNAKNKAILVISFLVVFSLFAISSVQAQPTEVWVDDDYTTTTPTWGTTHFDKIQDGINAVASGGMVHVAAGTYYEHVTIGKSLTLIGEDRGTTIIDGGGTGNVVYVVHADYVEISGFTVTSGGVDGISVWYSNHNKLTDLNVHSNGRFGILTQHSQYNFISNVDTHSNDAAGIGLGWRPSHSIITSVNAYSNLAGISVYDWPTNVTITDCNAYSNIYDGIVLGWTTDGLIRNCTAHDNGRRGILLDCDRYCTVADSYVGSNPEGIRVYAHYSGFIHNTITNCDVESNDHGIIVCGREIWYLYTTIKNCDIRNNEGGISVSGKGNTINCNNIVNNTVYGVKNTIVTYLDATQNWWGDTSGPSGVGPGTGDAVSTNVDFDPWSFTPDPCETKTLGFWKKHEDSVDVLGYPILLGDYSVEDFEDAEDVFNNAKNKNANTMLAAQLLAAKLNVLHLAHLAIAYCPCVNDVISDADTFLSGHGYNGPDDPGTAPRGSDKQEAEGYKDDLDEYNQGECPCTPAP